MLYFQKTLGEQEPGLALSACYAAWVIGMDRDEGERVGSNGSSWRRWSNTSTATGKRFTLKYGPAKPPITLQSLSNCALCNLFSHNFEKCIWPPTLKPAYGLVRIHWNENDPFCELSLYALISQNTSAGGSGTLISYVTKISAFLGAYLTRLEVVPLEESLRVVLASGPARSSRFLRAGWVKAEIRSWWTCKCGLRKR